MILPALALPSKLAGLSFLVTFLLGTILAMGSYTACIGASCEMLGERVPWVSHPFKSLESASFILYDQRVPWVSHLFKSLESARFTFSERVPCVSHTVKSSKVFHLSCMMELAVQWLLYAMVESCGDYSLSSWYQAA
jgi:hypothetical protein